MEKKLKLRSEIEEKYKWDLSKIVSSKEDFNHKTKIAKEELSHISDYKGKVCESAASLEKALNHKFSVLSKLEVLYVYAHLVLDTDLSNIEAQKQFDEASALFYQADALQSFIIPEILEFGEEKIEKYIQENKNLEVYTVFLKRIFREKEHILDTEKEEMLSQFSSVTSYFEASFNFARNKEIEYGTIIDEEGNEVELLPSNFERYLLSKDRRVRKEALLARDKAYESRVDSITSNLIGHIKASETEAKIRHYDSALQADLYDLNIPYQVYENVLKKGTAAKNIYQKYLRLRQKVLHVDTLESWDLAVSLAADTAKSYSYEEAQALLLDAFQIYGEEYVTILKEAFDKRWIDVYPNKNKKTGWYSTSLFEGHPVVLANYEGRLYDVSALAHECGHMVHFALAKKNQPYIYSDYSLFEAEVASLTNEILLSRYLLEKSTDKNEKLSLLSNMIEVFENNFFGTVQGSTFEEKVHQMANEGSVLTTDSMDAVWKGIQDNFLDDIVKPHGYHGWCRVPHFYNSFYYYKYATGITAAFYEAKNILENKEKAVKPYLEFLKVGQSKNPIEALQVAGIDMTREEVFDEAIQVFDSLLDEFIEVYNS